MERIREGWTAEYNGKIRQIKRRASTKTEAKMILKKIIFELESRGSKAIANSEITFDQLAAYFSERYVKPPVYVDGRKVMGMRQWKNIRFFIQPLVSFFGGRKIRAITHGVIESYKEHRFNTPTKHGKQRSIACVNRELQVLRRILNVAVREGWLTKNPFGLGASLISHADEKHRERIITFNEEDRLLSVCKGKRTHLRLFIICGLDTGMRSGEIFKMQWKDFDFASRVINIPSFNTKTMRERQVAMTDRLYDELMTHYTRSNGDPDSLVFRGIETVKRAFASARNAAGVHDVRPHDMRHTAATRMIQAGVPLAEVALVLGHRSVATTMRYVNRTTDTIHRAASALDQLRCSAVINSAEQSPTIN